MGGTENRKHLIGLTGTIGSGKSFVAGVLGELGAEIIDTDVIAREVVEPGTEGLEAIVDRWGEEVLKEDGTLDREAVAAIVFKDDSERQWLNGLLHPMIGRETARRIEASDARVVVLVVPLLFESGMDRMVESTWVVAADERKLVERITGRDGCSEEEALGRIRSQMSQVEKMKRADVVIDNSGSMEQAREQVEEAWQQIEKP